MDFDRIRVDFAKGKFDVLSGPLRQHRASTLYKPWAWHRLLNIINRMSAPCEPCEPLDLETEWRLLDALPVVDTVLPDIAIDKQRNIRKNRVSCTLWCGASHPPGDLRRPAVICNQSTVPSVEHAVRALRLKIEAAHGGCLAAAEAARAAAAAPATREPADTFAAMMSTARSRRAASAADAAEKTAAALRALADAAAAEEREQAGGMQHEPAKRQRSDAADFAFWKPWLEATPQSVVTWDLKQWRTGRKRTKSSTSSAAQ